MSDKPKKPRSKKTGSTARKRSKSYASYRGNAKYRGRRGAGKMRAWLGRFIPARKQVVAKLWKPFLVLGVLLSFVLFYFWVTLPSISAIDTIRKQQGITVEAADGHPVANYGDVYGAYIPYDHLPKSLIQAVIATEDRRFFEHHGIDMLGILRAMVTNVIHGHLVQGGSTVTQQVAKNVFLTPERSASRKIQEVMLAFSLEARYSKKEIMAIYLNRVYFGSGTYGVDAAARRYFNKSAPELTLEESALLAGLLKAPSRYSPAANISRSRERTHQVLLNMEDAGFITMKQVDAAMGNYSHIAEQQSGGGDVRYYTDWILDEIPGVIGQVDDDLIVTTTLDPALQAQAVDSLQQVISTEGPAKHVSQGALVSMAPDGAVKAMVGGVSYGKSQYNRAAQAKRQPGSSFKLFVYLSAIEAGYTPQTMVTDAPISLSVGDKTWSPDNNEKNEYRGDIPLYEALRHSLNTVSVRIITAIGPERVAAMAERLGVPNIPAYPSIALGAVEATLVEMTGAYAHLPNQGNRVVPYGIVSIRTRQGVELYKREAPTDEPVLAKGTVEMMNYMLLDVVRHGTGFKAHLNDRDAAGKTGTSSDYKDAWFIGFTPQLVTGVWVGNDDNKPMKKITGGTIPAEIWHNFMTLAMKDVRPQSIPNSASSSDGLLPWLFGGSDTAAPAGANNPPPSPTPASAIPANSPFGYAHPERAPAQPNAPGQGAVPTPAPPPTPNGTPQPVAPAGGEAPAPATETPPGDAGVLSPQFWKKLADKAPTIDHHQVQYSYPKQNRP